MPEFDTVFQQVAAVLFISALVGGLAHLLRQPLIVAFIAVGILVGPAGVGIVDAHDEIELLATIGIALLLFVVGLRLDLHLIRTVGPVAVASGLGQVLFTSGIGYAIARGLGYDTVPALYIAVALTFSSTIIIVKLLSDKGEIEDLHGRIAVGFLIVQDIVVVLVMITLSAFGAEGQGDGVAADLAFVLVRGGLFLGGIAVLMKWVLPPLLHRLAHLPELLVLFAIAWAVALAAAGDVLGFSEEVGAFLAGVSLASTPYRDAVGSRLTGLRDFLILFFFISLGAQLDFGEAGAQLAQATVLSLFVLLGNPLIVLAIMGAMGYRKRTSFLAGLTVAQISEFSLILVALGLGLGHIGGEVVGLVTLVGMITIGLSTYLILYSHPIYDRLAPVLGAFERRQLRPAPPDTDEERPRVIVFGLGRYGGNIVKRLHEAGVPVLGVDFDPMKLHRWAAEGVPVRYGDAEDPEFFGTLPFAEADWVVSATPRPEANLALAHALRSHGFAGRIALTSHRDEDAAQVQSAEPDLLLRPFKDAAADAVRALGERG